MDKKQQYEQTLQTVSNIENTKQALLTKFNKISDADKQNINTILPNSFNFTKLISQIDTVAESYGIAIKDVTSQDMNPTAGSSIADAQPKSPYSSAVIGFSFSAPYNKFSGFLNDLEKSTRILDINSLQLKVDEKGNSVPLGKGGYLVINTGITSPISESNCIKTLIMFSATIHGLISLMVTFLTMGPSSNISYSSSSISISIPP